MQALPAGLYSAALLGLWTQLSFLLVALLPVVMENLRGGGLSSAVTYVLLGAVSLSRSGLFLTDLGCGQMLQVMVPPEHLGAPWLSSQASCARCLCQAILLQVGVRHGWVQGALHVGSWNWAGGPQRDC